MIDPNNQYTQMQVRAYEDLANKGSERVLGNPLERLNVGNWYLLFEGLATEGKRALDFGCGPGRNIALHGPRFAQLDGVDLSNKVLDLARAYLSGCYQRPYKLILCNGVDLSAISDETYDVVMSTIVLQHICVHDIRLNYFREFYRVLKTGGWFTAQMGFGHRQGGVGYADNHYGATSTNGTADVLISDPAQLETDVTTAGFRNFLYTITERHETDVHDSWIFFRAQK